MSQDKTAAKFRLKEVIMLVVAALGLFLLIALLTYSPDDPVWSSSTAMIANAGGRAGSIAAYGLFAFFGAFAYLVPIAIWYWLLLGYLERDQSHGIGFRILRGFGCLLVFIAGSGLIDVVFSSAGASWPAGAGGVLGGYIGHDLLPFLNYVGSVLVLVVVLLIGMTFFSGIPWLHYIVICVRALGRGLGWSGRKMAGGVKKNVKQTIAKRKDKLLALPKPTAKITSRPHRSDAAGEEVADTAQVPLVQPEGVEQAKAGSAGKGSKVKARKSGKATQVRAVGSASDIPSIELLDSPIVTGPAVSKDYLESMASLVEQRLSDFGIKAKVVGACPGPIVTRYELELAPGVKVSKLSGLSKDLARSLAAHSVRIVEVIPGKAVVGLEVPNDKRETVSLKQVLASNAFSKNKSALAMGLGKDIAGESQVVDLGKMPHLLVAGTTGSGKSVGVNAMILSMLLKAKPSQLRLIMIDPKMLELSVYEGIPHLLTPVVTDMKEAANALRWCVREMDRRYRLMAALGVRGITSLNEKIEAARAKQAPLKDPIWLQTHPNHAQEDAPDLEPVPFVVVVVDEFADMMMVVGKKVEELIARLAQKARASGIHLILATQRPSVDVITGLIKANIPCRIAFQVSSRIDSRTILDQQGAEQLLGHGDMLYLPPGSGISKRIHGAFVSDQEVHAVVAAWKERGEPEYMDSITAETEEDQGGDSDSDGEKDPLYDEAVKVVLDTQRASISGVQRRLKIGYNRAARLLETMEQSGVVSEVQSNGMREILVGNN